MIFDKIFSKNTVSVKTSSIEALEDNLKLSIHDNTIVFAINEDNELVIKLSIQNLEPKHAIKFAEVLYLLSRNAYRSELIEMMQTMSKEDPSRSEFIDEVILYWASLVDKYEKEEYYNSCPLISPTKFSQLVINTESKT